MGQDIQHLKVIRFHQGWISSTGGFGGPSANPGQFVPAVMPDTFRSIRIQAISAEF
jgi:hypothetical protein